MRIILFFERVAMGFKEDHELRIDCYLGNNKKILNWIKQGADINSQDRQSGETALMNAIKSGKPAEIVFEMVCRLIEHGADIQMLNHAKENALFYACRANLHNVADYLVKQGININQVNEKAEKAIDVIPGKSIVDLLLGKDNKKVVDNERIVYLKKEITKACENFHHKKLDQLLTEFGKVNYQIDGNGTTYSTPLITVCTHYKESGNRIKAIDVLFKHSADANYPISYPEDRHPNIRFSEGCTPLMLVSSKADLSVARKLIENGADVNAKNSYNADRSVLYYAIAIDNIEYFKVLVEHGADWQAVDKEGRNLLHHACYESSLRIGRWLVEHGVDPSIKNNAGDDAYKCLFDSVRTGKDDRVKFGEYMASYVEQNKLQCTIDDKHEEVKGMSF